MNEIIGRQDRWKDFAQAEIDQAEARLRARLDDDVGRFDVTMNHDGLSNATGGEVIVRREILVVQIVDGFEKGEEKGVARGPGKFMRTKVLIQRAQRMVFE